jgi:hypothetical protein
MSLDLLLCGKSGTAGLAQTALGQLSNSIRSFSAKGVKFLNEDFSDDTRTFAPFCTRVLLENGCAALLGRLDCFRILYLSEFQSQPEYKVGERAKSSFSWTGDIIPEKQSVSLWNADSDMLKISRALFSHHVDHIFWKPAVDGISFLVSPRTRLHRTCLTQIRKRSLARCEAAAASYTPHFRRVFIGSFSRARWCWENLRSRQPSETLVCY